MTRFERSKGSSTKLSMHKHVHSIHYGKEMKQRATTVLLGILMMISFCLDHTSIEVNDFWTGTSQYIDSGSPSHW